MYLKKREQEMESMSYLTFFFLNIKVTIYCQFSFSDYNLCFNKQNSIWHEFKIQ